jgi:hypothetical protein
VYHLELRKFPHVVCRFNQSEAQLRAIVVPWVREQWIEEGERKWNANEATLTVLEGPELSMPQLAMGKGWRNAQKRSEDVTERVLEAARPQGPAGPEADLLADSLALELLALLDGGPLAPARAWRLAQERLAARGGSASAAASIALAERAVGSLLERGLAVLCGEGGGGEGRDREIVTPERREAVLAAIETWAREDPSPVLLARAG